MSCAPGRRLVMAPALAHISGLRYCIPMTTRFDAEFHDDGLHNAAKYWRQLQEARRETDGLRYRLRQADEAFADLRAKSAHLAAERDGLRAEVADLRAQLVGPSGD